MQHVFCLQKSRVYFRLGFRGTMTSMFVPLILICSLELGCKTIAGPMVEDLVSCYAALDAGSLVLGPQLRGDARIAGGHCLEWISGEKT